jgi:glutathione S-transferase
MMRITGVLLAPIAPIFARIVEANDDQVRHDLGQLPGVLDEVDRLIARGVIGNETLCAADFQIAPSIRMLLAMEDVASLIADRPAALLARRVVADYPNIPPVLPGEWMPAKAPE